MADMEDSSLAAEGLLDEEQQNESSLLEENDNEVEDTKDQNAEELNHEDEESALHDEDTEHQNDTSLLDDDAQSKMDGADERAAAADNIVIADEEGKAGELEDEDEVEDGAKPKDANEMPQVNVANLAKRKWQVKIYPLKPDDFSNGQISRVFSNARESLLYLLSSGRSSGGKGEMYVSSAVQASKVVQNLMKLDFKSSTINIEIVKKNDEGAIEEKGFMRFDAKLVRMLCVPLLPTRRMGSKRERIIGSVFVKNLPKGTSKDMLRVMFPFAPEINYNPDKFQDGTARLVLSTRNAVNPCLKAFAKVELGDSMVELRPLQKKPKSADDKSSDEKGESVKKSESKDGAGESEGKTSDKKESSKSSDKKDSGKDQGKTASKRNPSSSKSTDGKKEKSKDKDQATKTDTGRTHSAADRNKNVRDRGNRRWRNSRDSRGDAGLRNMRNRNRGGDRNRFRSGGAFGIRNRSNDRRMRPGLVGASAGDAAINTEATKEMFLLQSQLSMAIKNQLSMLNQTQFALEQAKRGAASVNMSREVAQAAPASLLSKHVPDPYGMSQLPSEQTRRAQVKPRRQRNNRGRSPRDKRADGEHLASLVGDYSYKRNASVASLGLDYGTSGFGKRRNAGLSGHGDGPSWADEASAYGHAQSSAFGYEQEMDEREAEYRSLQAGSLNSSSLSYGHGGGYGYRY